MLLNIEQTVIEGLRILTPEEQRDVADFIQTLLKQNIIAKQSNYFEGVSCNYLYSLLYIKNIFLQ